MNKLKVLWLLLVAFVTVPTMAQQLPQLPMDKDVRYGKLENGLTYYVRHNALPENRVNFYIAQKVGSVQEEEPQRGLAHFLEHMCFNGTKNFPGNNLIRFCENIGVKFGQNLNAYTSTDETVYNIDDVPVTDTNVDSCLLILRDWSDGLLLEPEEIDKERGVIHEEWRLRNSGSQRILARNLPRLYEGSRYGERFPIGLMSVVDNFKPAELRAYYEKWYRPDLQGIIVVGDIDAAQVEQKIKDTFGSIEMPENAAKYLHYPVPTTPEAMYLIDKDPEQTTTLIEIMYKHEPMPEEFKNTPVFLQMNYLETLVCQSFNARLEELSQKADCPFIGAQVGYGNFIMSKTMEAFTVYVLPKPGKDAEAVQTVMEEIERAKRFGFTGTEIARQDEEFINGMEVIYNNRDKQKNAFYAPQYVRHFLEGNPIPDIETEFTIYKQLSQMMTAQNVTVPSVNELFKQYTASTDTNFICLAMYPEKEGVVVPTADQFKQAIANAKAAKLEAYVDNVKDEPLVPVLPKKGKIVKESQADFGYTCWKLSNGARVYYKKTDFNDTQVLFGAQSFGGLSLVDQKDLVNAELLPMVMQSTGIGNFNVVELGKKMAGKNVGCNAMLGNLTDNLSGSSTPKDLRTLFELIYLRFQEPANDQEGFNNIFSYLKSTLVNAEKNPETAFSDSLNVTYYGNHPRKQTLKLASLDQVDYQTIRRIYTERFKSAGDFDFFFTGAFDVDSLREFTEQYIASIKGSKKREKFVNHKIYPVEGVVSNHFYRDMETPKGNIVQLWHGDLKYTLKNNAIMNALGEILTQRYLKSIREEAGFAYSVGAGAAANYGTREQYTLQIFCPVQPANLDSALVLMRQAIEDIAASGVTADELDKVIKFELKDFADSQKKNGYWYNLISSKVAWNKDGQKGMEEAIKSVTSEDIQSFVKNVLLVQNNCTTITMRPTDLTESDVK